MQLPENVQGYPPPGSTIPPARAILSGRFGHRARFHSAGPTSEEPPMEDGETLTSATPGLVPRRALHRSGIPVQARAHAGVAYDTLLDPARDAAWQRSPPQSSTSTRSGSTRSCRLAHNYRREGSGERVIQGIQPPIGAWPTSSPTRSRCSIESESGRRHDDEGRRRGAREGDSLARSGSQTLGLRADDGIASAAAMLAPTGIGALAEGTSARGCLTMLDARRADRSLAQPPAEREMEIGGRAHAARRFGRSAPTRAVTRKPSTRSSTPPPTPSLARQAPPRGRRELGTCWPDGTAAGPRSKALEAPAESHPGERV